MHQILLLILTFFVKKSLSTWLIVPPTSPTRHQLIWGVGIPLPLTLSVTTGYVFKAQYYVADHVSDLYLKEDTWAHITDVTEPERGTRRKRELFFDPQLNQTYERYDAEIDGEVFYENLDLKEESAKHQSVIKRLVEHREKFFGQSAEHGINRWHIYYAIEGIFEQRGLDGKACMLRMICEFAQAPITYYSGLLGEIAYIVLTPSTSDETPEKRHQLTYFTAERHGKEQKSCERLYRECDVSVLSYFTDT
ncbi:uncharacterized protein LOC134833488 [Culicoides brevitarsis]|uniref:uncharacterized protein LOC134833488 n=1 Tax=Culicoides brevitarsis TaxID=469753 RepID=UPI00307CB22F